MKELRRKAGYTQKQLGERIGVTQVYISQLEKGVIDGLTMGKFFKLAKALNVTPEEFVRTLANLKK